MPVISVHRFANANRVGGTIELETGLTVEGPVTLVLSPSVYTALGTYVLYTYTQAITYTGGATIASITIDKSNLTAPLNTATVTLTDTGTALQLKLS